MALRQCRHKGGEGKAYCRLIGDWYKKKLGGVVGMLGDEPAAFYLGYIRKNYFRMPYLVTSPSLAGFDVSGPMFNRLLVGMPTHVKNIFLTVDERDENTFRLLHNLGFKAVKVVRDWYAKGHDGVLWSYPIGRLES